MHTVLQHQLWTDAEDEVQELDRRQSWGHHLKNTAAQIFISLLGR